MPVTQVGVGQSRIVVEHGDRRVRTWIALDGVDGSVVGFDEVEGHLAGETVR